MQKLDTKISLNEQVWSAPNLTDRFDDRDLTTIGGLVVDGYNRDKQSRIRWERRMEAGMDLAMQIQKDKNWPWPNSSNVVFPLVTIAALQFSARAYSNIIQGTDIVRYRLFGEDPDGSRRVRADRISKHMSWQVLEEDTSWEEEHDRLLINLAIVGTAFVKTYFDPHHNHNVSQLVQARDLVMDYYAKSIECAARKTHVIPLSRNDIYERVKAETFRHVLDEQWFDQAPPAAPTNQRQDERQGLNIAPTDELTPFRSLEQHRLLDLDQDGYAEPYIVTVEETSRKVLRIVARFSREEDIERWNDKSVYKIRSEEYFTKYSFVPSPDGGIYDVGFGTLLGPLNESVNTGINQCLDAGTMHNSNGGFLGRGAKIRGGVYTMAPWEWKRVDSTGDDLRKSMVPLPTKEPSAVMLQLLELLINYTDRIAGTVDMMVGENPGQNTPAETSRNTTEQGMQVFSMIFKRVWRSMKEEYKKLYWLNSQFLPNTMHYGAVGSAIHREDYASNPDLIAPVADPNISSAGMRIGQAQLIRQAAHTVPGYDVQKVEKKFLQALKVDDIDEMYPGPDKVPPLPNPKMQIEEMKLKAKQMGFEHDKEIFNLELQAQRRKNDAEIHKLEAEVLQIMSGVKNDAALVKLKAFETAIDAIKDHNEMIGKSIETLSKYGAKPDDKGDGKGGGVSEVAGGSGDKGVPRVSPPVGSNGAGAMG